MSRAGRPRICFVLPSLAGGGAERAAVHIINALDPGRWDRSMYLFEKTGPYLADLSPAVTLVSGSAAGRAARWSELRRFIRDSRPDMVMSFLSYFTVLTAARAAFAGVRVAFNQQTPMSAFLTDADYQWRRRWHRTAFSVVTRLGYRAADLIVTTSRGVADDLSSAFGVPADGVRVVPNPVDLDTVRSAAAEPVAPEHAAQWTRPVIVAAGRLADAKNYPLMIEAVAHLRKTVPVRLFILGQGELEAPIRELIRARGLENAVTLCGFQRNPWRYIARADVFLLTSRYEGFGNVLVEAMACGVPVVATASAGTMDIVRDGVNGRLVESHSPESVAAAVEAIVRSPAERERLADGARVWSQRFSLAAVAAEYDSVLSRVVA